MAKRDTTTPTLFPLVDDARPVAERSAAERYLEPDLFSAGFGDRVSRHIAGSVERCEADRLSEDLANASAGIPRDAAQAKRWQKLGIAPGGNVVPFAPKREG